MPDDAVLQGFDPYDVMDAEAARIDRHVSALGPAELDRPSACAGWSVKDLVGHLAGGEEYNLACLDDAIPALFERLGPLGVTDLDSFNNYGVVEWRPRPIGEVLDAWRSRCQRTRTELRHRDGGELPTMVGLYPVRWQAFHLASELVTHGDDIDAPPGGESLEWRPRFAVFALAEAKPNVTVDLTANGATVGAGDETATLSTDDFVAASNGRLPADHPLSPGVRAALNVVGS